MSDRGPVTVLIVEDQPIARAGLSLLLNRVPDIKVVGEADNGLEAVEQAAKLLPRVVVMDLGLPGIDGIEATRQIKSGLSTVRVLILTGRDDDNEVFGALGAGADGYCLKDASSDEIAMAIRTVGEGSCWIDPVIARKVIKEVKTPAADRRAGRSGAPKEKFVLSARELEVLALIVDGCTNQEIANKLAIGLETAKTHVRHVMEKLVVADRTQAAVKALREGLISR